MKSWWSRCWQNLWRSGQFIRRMWTLAMLREKWCGGFCTDTAISEYGQQVWGSYSRVYSLWYGQSLVRWQCPSSSSCYAEETVEHGLDQHSRAGSEPERAVPLCACLHWSFTKWFEIVPSKRLDGVSVASVFLSVCARWGPPEVFWCDSGSEFVNAVADALFKAFWRERPAWYCGAPSPVTGHRWAIQ